MLINESAARVLALASALLMAACTRSTGPDDRITFQLGVDEYAVVTADTTFVLQLRDGALAGTIPYEIANVSSQTASLSNCNGGYSTVLERWDGDDWSYVWSAVQLGCLSPAIEIAPDEALAGSLSIRAGYGTMTPYPPFPGGPVAGTYRIVISKAYWDYDLASNDGILLPERLRASNPFSIRVE